MGEPRDKRSAGQVEFLRVLMEEHTSIDDDVLEVASDVWVIHGVVPYDGEAPLAMFDSYDEAKVVLDEVCGVDAPDDL